MDIAAILEDSMVDEINILTGGLLISYNRTCDGWQEVDANIPHIADNGNMCNIIRYYITIRGARMFRREYLNGTRITIICNVGSEIK